MSRQYEMVGGLETHIELSTATKIFCGCTTAFGSEPNTHCCPICIGLPGTLPKLNRQAVRYAIMAGLVTQCTINPISKMDRKNYVYPDLPKAYQISQFDKPLCEHGYVELASGKKIRITRIHIEEDAGKLVHTRGDTFVDYNRGGVPLIEIVTEPDIRSVEEIREYLEKLQLMMKYIGISDCRMQEGSMRCDVNVSVRPAGEEKLGTRTEIKNMNSFTFIEKAVAYEVERQIDLLESGEEVVQETRRYDDARDVTESMRGKEDANDYRYFREPDLVTIATAPEEIESIRAARAARQPLCPVYGRVGHPRRRRGPAGQIPEGGGILRGGRAGGHPQDGGQLHPWPDFPPSGHRRGQGGLRGVRSRRLSAGAGGPYRQRQAEDEPGQIHPGKDAGHRQAGGRAAH